MSEGVGLSEGRASGWEEFERNFAEGLAKRGAVNTRPMIDRAGIELHENEMWHSERLLRVPNVPAEVSIDVARGRAEIARLQERYVELESNALNGLAATLGKTPDEIVNAINGINNIGEKSHKDVKVVEAMASELGLEPEAVRRALSQHGFSANDIYAGPPEGYQGLAWGGLTSTPGITLRPTDRELGVDNSLIEKGKKSRLDFEYLPMGIAQLESPALNPDRALLDSLGRVRDLPNLGVAGRFPSLNDYMVTATPLGGAINTVQKVELDSPGTDDGSRPGQQPGTSPGGTAQPKKNPFTPDMMPKDQGRFDHLQNNNAAVLDGSKDAVGGPAHQFADLAGVQEIANASHAKFQVADATNQRPAGNQVADHRVEKLDRGTGVA